MKLAKISTVPIEIIDDEVDEWGIEEDEWGLAPEQ